MKKLIISTLIALAIGLAVIASISLFRKDEGSTQQPETNDESSQIEEEPQKEGVIKDRDTGSTYDPEIAQVSPGGQKLYPDTSTALFGVSDLISIIYKKRSTIGDIPKDINTALYDYGAKHLNGEFSSLTIIPSSLSAETDSVTGSLRLGQGDTAVPFRVNIISPKSSSDRGYIIINKDSSSHNGTYVYYGGLSGASGQNFSIQQAQSGSKQLVINGSNKEGALLFIKGAGYKIPDLSITFSNYRSPF